MIIGWLRLAGCIFFAALAGCSSLPDKTKIPTANTSQQIYFIYREWHTSILLPANMVRSHSKVIGHEAAGQQFVRIGWGDGDYFTGKSKSFGTATRALFISRYSALQVLTYTQAPFNEIPAETRVPIAITDKGLRQLIRYIDNSFVRDDKGQLIPLPAYGEGVGHFYLAEGEYGLFSNCNTWSSRALQAAGLPVRSRLQLTAQSVFEQARAISDYQISQGRIPASQ
ncbi:DUF2459 domain-containing protein [Cellvibrio mixtus]|uniref:DUF2459 domain-containing protein n=1 Tax=Cellvibrio mixtus TaxID=39650 RepID=UPI000A7F9672|nr:DUF2459 domain-containing protein [Cellvibrio mixtus]